MIKESFTSGNFLENYYKLLTTQIFLDDQLVDYPLLPLIPLWRTRRAVRRFSARGEAGSLSPPPPSAAPTPPPKSARRGIRQWETTRRTIRRLRLVDPITEMGGGQRPYRPAVVTRSMSLGWPQGTAWCKSWARPSINPSIYWSA